MAQSQKGLSQDSRAQGLSRHTTLPLCRWGHGKSMPPLGEGGAQDPEAEVAQGDLQGPLFRAGMLTTAKTRKRMPVPAWDLEAVAHAQRVSIENRGSWGRETMPLQRCHSPVMGTSGRGCSFLQDGTNTVMSVWPRSRNQFTARRIPRQEKTSLFPWLGRRRGRGRPAAPRSAQEGGGLHSSPCLPWPAELLGSAPCLLAGGPETVFPAGSHTARDGQTRGFP